MIWKDTTWISFDTETSGKYPLDAEVCEIAAVKWQAGKVVDQFQSLVAVSKPMSDEVIKIHGITNDMIKDAPSMKEVIPQFAEFIKAGHLLAHHAPFDLGFLAIEFEKYDLELPTEAAFCTSLLSRKLFPESINHRLQTLVEFFNLEKGTAHRALDDAKACLEVGLNCFEKAGEDVTLDQLESIQGQKLYWKNYSIADLRAETRLKALLEALHAKSEVQIVYEGGSRPGEPRTLKPLGLVRTPNGDFLVGQDQPDQLPKRYFLNRISASRL